MIRLGVFGYDCDNPSRPTAAMIQVLSHLASKSPPRRVPDERRPWTPYQLAVAAVLLSVLAIVALAVDIPAASWIGGHRATGEVARLIRLSEVFGWGGTVILIILTGAVLDSRRWQVTATLLAHAFGSGLIADGLKLLIARVRPSAANLQETVWDTFLRVADAPAGYQQHSFPSAHAATAVGLAIGLATLYPRGRWLFVSFAFLASIQRIEAQAHFPSDVLVGAALGCSVGAICRWRMGYYSRKSSVEACLP